MIVCICQIRFHAGQKRRVSLLDGVTGAIVNFNVSRDRHISADRVLLIPCAGVQIEGIATLAAVPGCKIYCSTVQLGIIMC